MGKLDQPGYPLPAGELGEDEIVCQLVFLPNRPEYWQAFVSAYHYMTTWRAWERDEGKRGRDAASNWRAAFELTMECWRMACLQDLQDDVAAILAIMQMGQSCCDGMDITDGDQYTDRVEDGVGDVPQNIIDAGYADDAADWAGFADYKCMISYVIVDQLPAKLAELQAVITPWGAVAGGLAAITAILAVIFSAGGAVLAFGVVVGVGSASLLYEALIGFGSLTALAAKVVTNRDELACSVYQSDGDEGALVALNDKIDELFTVLEAVILKNMNLGPTLKSLYAGRYDQQDIADILLDAGYDLGDFDCDVCDQIGEFRWTTVFPEADYEGWQNQNISITENGRGGGWCVDMHLGSIQNQLYLDMDELLDIAGITAGAGDVLILNSIKFYYHFDAGSETRGLVLRNIFDHDGGSETFNHLYVLPYTEVEHIFSPPLEMTYNTLKCILFYPSTQGQGWAYIDDITLDIDYTPA